MYKKHSESTTKFFMLKSASETRLLAHRTLIKRLTNYIIILIIYNICR